MIFLSKEYLEELLSNPYLKKDIKDKILNALQSGINLYKVERTDDFLLYNARDYINHLKYNKEQLMPRASIGICLSGMMSLLIASSDSEIQSFGFIFLILFCLALIIVFFACRCNNKMIKKVEMDNKEFLKLIRQANVKM